MTRPDVRVKVPFTVTAWSFKVSVPPLFMAEVTLVSVGAEVKVPSGITQSAAAVGLKLRMGKDVHVRVPAVLTIGATEPSPLKVRVLLVPLRFNTPFVKESVPFI